MGNWHVHAYGNDCLGNCTGWSVQRYVWVPSPLSKRADGLIQELEVAEQFVGNIYKPDEREQARTDAFALCDRLNREALH